VQVQKKKDVFFLRFFPESYKMSDNGRSSDLLLVYRLPILKGQWQEDDKQNTKELTAAGTVRDSHPVPY
jgi:hypothetical protein